MVEPWSEIARYYRELSGAGLRVAYMAKLVEQIETSPYAHGLYGWTSMHDLNIVQTPVTYPYAGPYLKISPLLNGIIEFRYLDSHIIEKQWYRMVNEDEAFARLESFIDQLHWYAECR